MRPAAKLAVVAAIALWGAWACWRVHQRREVAVAGAVLDFFNQERNDNAEL